ncbi:hypothetical protein BLNAU_19018 [Blattamonas nauphoetae]|uniref:Autophagy-related protein 2 n=1 Tax=Blattamonas nauphoetae TaxID=2049346 RepID=A0ABQ9X401_9EUKA|nr:hypothetical protein BLNAU_19018 [Blattamonas nauphoetae]
MFIIVAPKNPNLRPPDSEEGPQESQPASKTLPGIIKKLIQLIVSNIRITITDVSVLIRNKPSHILNGRILDPTNAEDLLPRENDILLNIGTIALSAPRKEDLASAKRDNSDLPDLSSFHKIWETTTSISGKSRNPISLVADILQLKVSLIKTSPKLSLHKSAKPPLEVMFSLDSVKLLALSFFDPSMSITQLSFYLSRDYTRFWLDVSNARLFATFDAILGFVDTLQQFSDPQFDPPPTQTVQKPEEKKGWFARMGGMFGWGGKANAEIGPDETKLADFVSELEKETGQHFETGELEDTLTWADLQIEQRKKKEEANEHPSLTPSTSPQNLVQPELPNSVPSTQSPSPLSLSSVIRSALDASVGNTFLAEHQPATPPSLLQKSVVLVVPPSSVRVDSLQKMDDEAVRGMYCTQFDRAGPANIARMGEIIQNNLDLDKEMENYEIDQKHRRLMKAAQSSTMPLPSLSEALLGELSDKPPSPPPPSLKPARTALAESAEAIRMVQTLDILWEMKREEIEASSSWDGEGERDVLGDSTETTHLQNSSPSSAFQFGMAVRVTIDSVTVECPLRSFQSPDLDRPVVDDILQFSLQNTDFIAVVPLLPQNTTKLIDSPNLSSLCPHPTIALAINSTRLALISRSKSAFFVLDTSFFLPLDLIVRINKELVPPTKGKRKKDQLPHYFVANAYEPLRMFLPNKQWELPTVGAEDAALLDADDGSEFVVFEMGDEALRMRREEDRNASKQLMARLKKGKEHVVVGKKVKSSALLLSLDFFNKNWVANEARRWADKSKDRISPTSVEEESIAEQLNRVKASLTIPPTHVTLPSDLILFATHASDVMGASLSGRHAKETREKQPKKPSADSEAVEEREEESDHQSLQKNQVECSLTFDWFFGNVVFTKTPLFIRRELTPISPSENTSSLIDISPIHPDFVSAKLPVALRRQTFAYSASFSIQDITARSMLTYSSIASASSTSFPVPRTINSPFVLSPELPLLESDCCVGSILDHPPTLIVLLSTVDMTTHWPSELCDCSFHSLALHLSSDVKSFNKTHSPTDLLLLPSSSSCHPILLVDSLTTVTFIHQSAFSSPNSSFADVEHIPRLFTTRLEEGISSFEILSQSPQTKTESRKEKPRPFDIAEAAFQSEIDGIHQNQSRADFQLGVDLGRVLVCLDLDESEEKSHSSNPNRGMPFMWKQLNKKQKTSKLVHPIQLINHSIDFLLSVLPGASQPAQTPTISPSSPIVGHSASSIVVRCSQTVSVLVLPLFCHVSIGNIVVSLQRWMMTTDEHSTSALSLALTVQSVEVSASRADLHVPILSVEKNVHSSLTPPQPKGPSSGPSFNQPHLSLVQTHPRIAATPICFILAIQDQTDRRSGALQKHLLLSGLIKHVELLFLPAGFVVFERVWESVDLISQMFSKLSSQPPPQPTPEIPTKMHLEFWADESLVVVDPQNQYALELTRKGWETWNRNQHRTRTQHESSSVASMIQNAIAPKHDVEQPILRPAQEASEPPADTSDPPSENKEDNFLIQQFGLTQSIRNPLPVFSDFTAFGKQSQSRSISPTQQNVTSLSPPTPTVPRQARHFSSASPPRKAQRTLFGLRHCTSPIVVHASETDPSIFAFLHSSFDRLSERAERFMERPDAATPPNEDTHLTWRNNEKLLFLPSTTLITTPISKSNLLLISSKALLRDACFLMSGFAHRGNHKTDPTPIRASMAARMHELQFHLLHNVNKHRLSSRAPPPNTPTSTLLHSEGYTHVLTLFDLMFKRENVVNASSTAPEPSPSSIYAVHANSVQGSMNAQQLADFVRLALSVSNLFRGGMQLFGRAWPSEYFLPLRLHHFSEREKESIIRREMTNDTVRVEKHEAHVRIGQDVLRAMQRECSACGRDSFRLVAPGSVESTPNRLIIPPEILNDEKSLIEPKAKPPVAMAAPVFIHQSYKLLHIPHFLSPFIASAPIGSLLPSGSPRPPTSMIVNLFVRHTLLDLTLPTKGFIEVQLLHFGYQYESFLRIDEPFWAPSRSQAQSLQDFVFGTLVVKDRSVGSTFDIILGQAENSILACQSPPERIVRVPSFVPRVFTNTKGLDIVTGFGSSSFELGIVNGEYRSAAANAVRLRDSRFSLTEDSPTPICLHLESHLSIGEQDVPVSHSYAFYHLSPLFVNLHGETMHALLLFFAEMKLSDADRVPLPIDQIQTVALSPKELECLPHLLLLIPPPPPTLTSKFHLSLTDAQRQSIAERVGSPSNPISFAGYTTDVTFGHTLLIASFTSTSVLSYLSDLLNTLFSPDKDTQGAVINSIPSFSLVEVDYPAVHEREFEGGMVGSLTKCFSADAIFAAIKNSTIQDRNFLQLLALVPGAVQNTVGSTLLKVMKTGGQLIWDSGSFFIEFTRGLFRRFETANQDGDKADSEDPAMISWFKTIKHHLSSATTFVLQGNSKEQQTSIIRAGGRNNITLRVPHGVTVYRNGPETEICIAEDQADQCKGALILHSPSDT